MEPRLLEKLVTIRRTLHQHPELGYNEYQTSALICRELDNCGIPYRINIAKTGVVASLTKGKGPIVVLRADMDALPIQEETDLEYKSDVNGVMHACVMIFIPQC